MLAYGGKRAGSPLALIGRIGALRQLMGSSNASRRHDSRKLTPDGVT